MYALAHDLIGFSRSTLRVRVERIDGRNVWIRTADLCDAGTALVLDVDQVTPEPGERVLGRAARGGLVFFLEGAR